MVWDVHEANWLEMYQFACEYYEEKGDLLIPEDYIIYDYIKLGSWISEQRKLKVDNSLSEERIRLLEEIGMIWDIHEYNFIHNKITKKI